MVKYRNLMFVLFTFFLFSNVASYTNISDILKKIDININNQDYNMALTIIKNELKKHNENFFLITKAFDIFKLYADKKMVKDFVLNYVLPLKNPEILSSTFLILYQNKFYNIAYQFMTSMVTKNLLLNSKVKSYIPIVVNKAKKEKAFNTFLTKLENNQLKKENIRLYFLPFLDPKEQKNFFSNFNKNSYKFKAYLLEYYNQTSPQKFDELYEKIKNDSLNHRILFAKKLFGMQKYQYVINLFNKNEYRTHQTSYSFFELLFDSFILTEQYKKAAAFCIQFNYCRFYLNSFSITNTKFYKALLNEMKDKYIEKNYLLKYAYLAKDYNYMENILKENSNDIFYLIQGVFFGREDLKEKFLLKVFTIIFKDNLIKTDLLDNLLTFLDNNRLFFKLYPDLLGYLKANHLSLSDHFKFLQLKNGIISLNDIKTYNPQSRYGKLIKNYFDFKNNKFGNIHNSILEFNLIDQFLNQYYNKPIIKKVLFQYIKRYPGMDFTIFLRYAIIKNLRPNQLYNLLKNYAFIKFLNIQPDIREKNDEAELFLYIFYEYKQHHYKQVIQLIENNKNKFNYFKKILSEIEEEIPNAK